jgi:S1-C subfamily serine protease
VPKVSNSIRILSLILTTVALASNGLGAPFDYKTALKSVVQVSADNCPGGARKATGFVWKQGTFVVTAWHAVGGCANLSAYSQTNGNSYQLNIVKVYKEADLALLVLQGGGTLPTLSEVAPTAVLQADQDLHVVGFPFGSVQATGWELHLGFGGQTLGSLVSPSVLGDLKKYGSPDPTMNVLLVDKLVPGLSGAPIMNDQGELVGIADGGLQGGAVGIDWALQHTYLTQLFSSNENPSAAASLLSDANHFSFDIDAIDGPDITCGDFVMKKIREVGLAEAMHGTDDPPGLQYLMTTLLGINDPSSFSFSVYQNLNSGAILVLPVDFVVVSNASGCTASMPNTDIKMTIELRSYQPTPGVADDSSPGVFSVRSQFETDVMSSPASVWTALSMFTYQAPIGRFDGFAVKRKGFAKNITLTGESSESLFETVTIKRGTFMGVSADVVYSPAYSVKLLNACQVNATPPACSMAQATLHQWQSALLAVHLSTFAIG